MIILIIKVTYLLETRLASYPGSMGRGKIAWYQLCVHALNFSRFWETRIPCRILSVYLNFNPG